MSDEKFKELINLYLDREISSRDLDWLRQELASSSARKREFEERCRLHQAMQLALNPQMRASAESYARRPYGRALRTQETGDASGKGSFPRWVLGSGLAASLVVGLVLLKPVFTDSMEMASSVKGVDLELLRSEQALEFVDADLRRYSSVQRQAARREMRGTSLAAQFRLLGLAPGIGPGNSELVRVDAAAVDHPVEPEMLAADLLIQLQGFTPMPEPRLFEAVERPVHAENSIAWGSGFDVSLASFR